MRWPALCWVESDGSTGIRLFMSVEEARAWQAGESERHPDWDWVLDETMAVPGRSIFTIDHQAAGSHAELVRKTLIRFYAEFCDCYLVRDWGTEALQPLSPFGHVGEPDRYGVTTVTEAVTPEAVTG